MTDKQSECIIPPTSTRVPLAKREGTVRDSFYYFQLYVTNSTCRRYHKAKPRIRVLSWLYLKLEELLDELHGVVGAFDRMADRARVLVDLVIVSTGEALVAEEVDFRILGARNVLLGFDVLQAECLVPACWEYVEGDLAADGETRLGDSVRITGRRKSLIT